MPRRCFALDVVPALAAEYAVRHLPGAVWPEVITHLRAQGVEQMEIWHTGDRLFMIAEVAADYPRAVPPSPTVERWEAYMWHYQRPLAHAAPGEKWVEMEELFHLAEEQP